MFQCCFTIDCHVFVDYLDREAARDLGVQSEGLRYFCDAARSKIGMQSVFPSKKMASTYAMVEVHGFLAEVFSLA